MDDFDNELRSRLSRMEARLPVQGAPSSPRMKMPMRLSAGVAGGLAALTLLAGAVAGATISSQVRGHPGLFAPGGVFYCTQIRQLSPPQAEAALEKLGYIVTWQIEDRSDGSSVQTPTAPAAGYIIEGVLEDAELILVVEVGDGAAPVPEPTC